MRNFRCVLTYFLTSELFNLSTCVDGNSFPELNAALTDTVNATQALVTKFVQLSDHKLNSLQNGSFTEYQETKNEVFWYS
jgi:E3 ubiquitin-protein ligase BRE1